MPICYLWEWPFLCVTAIRCPANRKQDIFTLELETLWHLCIFFAMFYLPWNSEIGNLGRGLSYPHSFQTTTKLPLNLPTTAGKIHIGSKEGLVGKFLVSNIPMGGKTGKQNKKQTRCAVFFFMDVSGFGGFQRRFLWEVVKIWPKKKGGFQHRRPTNFSIPWRAGIGLIRFYARLSF